MAGGQGVSGCAAPKRVTVSLETDVKQGMLEAGRFVVAPSFEVSTVDEKERLAGARAVVGDFFAFDIQTSAGALEEESDLAVKPTCVGAACVALRCCGDR